MSEGQGRPGANAGDLVDAPFIDDRERAESAWLLAREDDPDASAPSPAIARDYAELEDLLGESPPMASDEGWQEEVLRLAAASEPPARPPPRRRAYRWAIAGALVAAAALVLVVLRPGPRPRVGELEVELRHGDRVRGDAREAAVGDRLIVRAPLGTTGDLRVYRADGALVARCPAGPACAGAEHGEHAVDVTLDAPLTYHVILVVEAPGGLPGGSLDAYLDAARAAHARIVTYPPIVVH